MALFGCDCGEGMDDVEWVNITRSAHTPAPLPDVNSKISGVDTKKDGEFSLPNTPLACNCFIQVTLEDRELPTDLPPHLTPPPQQRHP